eukprot:Em0003g1126a
MLHTTLFGGVLKDVQHIYKVPRDAYEKFIELWWQRARREKPGASKNELLKQAQVKWKAMKNSPKDLENFFTECEKQGTESGQYDVEVPDYGFSRMTISTTGFNSNQEAHTEDSNVISCHMPNYTWEMAFQKLEDQQNSGVSGFPLQDDDLSHELIMTGDGFEALLLVDQVPKSSHKKPSEKETTFCLLLVGTHSQIGRPSLVSQFPSIVSTAASFVKANGFSAHERRRESIGKPPRHGTRASLRYKGQVAARVPGKRNQYREFHTDQHYLFAQVAYRREFSVMFENECALFSCDDMNKIKVGALAVSRYHQIQRFFPVDDVPNVPDHDFPVPGYLLIPSGYMRLVKKPSPTANAMYLEGEDMTEYRDDGLNDTCTMSLATAVRTSAHEGHARYSAYNPIEHLWSVLSKNGITDEQRKAKESQVFDDAIEEIADVHWNNAVFDGFPITPVPVKCSDHLQVIMT